MANSVREWGKPLVISETGAGGIFEWSKNETDDKWTLNYQTEIISSDVDVAISNHNISGISLWHFYDFKVDNCGAHWPCKGGSGLGAGLRLQLRLGLLVTGYCYDRTVTVTVGFAKVGGRRTTRIASMITLLLLHLLSSPPKARRIVLTSL